MTTKFEQIKQLIKEDSDFQNQLKSISDQETWIKDVIQFGKEKGISVTSEEVNERIGSRLEQLAAAGQLRLVGEIMGHSPSSAATSPL